MKLISNVSSHNENNDGGCALAAIDLTPQLAQLALRRIETFRAVKAHDESADEIYYWNYDPIFFDPFISAENDRGGEDIPEGRKALSGEELLARLDSSPNGFIEVDAPFEIPESHISRLDCCEMAVRNDGIAFVAIPKHASFYVETRELPIDIVRRAAELS